MRTTRIPTILVLALGLTVWSAPIVYGAQSLTVNGEPLDSVTLEVGRSCTVEVVSDDSRSYADYVGFDNGVILGTFSHRETARNAGDLAGVTEYSEAAFYGYYVVADGSTLGRPRAGVHFVFEYGAQQVGETDVRLYDKTRTSVMDSVHITVTPKPMGTVWTYQGRLIDANDVAEGLYDFEFRLYGAPNGGVQEGDTIDVNDLDVVDGYFTVELDFGSVVFGGDARWLGVSVRPGDSKDPDAFVTLSPRQELTPAPYALYAKTAPPGHSLDAADGSPTNSVYVDDDGNVGIGTTSPGRKLDVAGYINAADYYFLNDNVLVYNSKGSGTFYYGWDTGVKRHSMSTEGVQRLVIDDSGNVGIGTTSPSAKLDVDGDINTSSTYRIGGSTVLSVTGTNNTHVGVGAGENNTAGSGTFVGYNVGYNNQGYYNTFMGNYAGYSNTAGHENTFLGYGAGYSNTGDVLEPLLSSFNTFLGFRAGHFNTTGLANTFLGHDAGTGNTTGSENTFVGQAAGYENTEGRNNTFLGFWAGHANLTGDNNTFLGNTAGFSNTTGTGNVFIGYKAGYNVIDANDKLYIANGPEDSDTLIYGDFSTGRVGIGTTSPDESLTVEGTLKASSTGVYSKAVWGVNHGVGGIHYGGYFEAEGDYGHAVFGKATGKGGHGLYGYAEAEDGIAVRGQHKYVGGLAGYFVGDVEITGNLTKGGGSFQIDHPLDPEHKLLQHSFVESPDMMNVYNGNAALDENGEARVQLPEYFEALNRDFRYQLTCIGGFAPVYIAEKICNNRFVIAGGKKGMEVSWQVTGVRQDAYAKANRIVVEKEKCAEERGYYLHPSAYGLPEEKGMEGLHNARVSETHQVARNIR